MTTQPEALRLADELEFAASQIDAEDDVIHVARWFVEDAAAELRRLHEAHDWQHRMAGERLRRVEKLEAQRDALMEALKDAAEAFELASNGGGVDFYAYAQQFREDIAKAEENT